MKLFQKLLLAPAALGLMAPVAASAADLNVAGMRQYISSEEQVTSVSQFSDVRPNDFAYKALQNLIERYNCIAGFPGLTGLTFKGDKAITRYEAAAILNACLESGAAATDEVKRLVKEFETERAVLKGRVDSMEAKVGALEATQFSTTTKLKGTATFVLGGTSFSGTYDSTGYAATADTPAYWNTNYGGTTFNYDVRLSLDTSFTGKDLLRTTLRAGNFGGTNGSSYGQGELNSLTFLETAFEEAGDNVITVQRLFYNFPVGDELSVTAGPQVRVDDAGMLGIWPSAYPADTVLDFFTYAGSPTAYNLLSLGGGAGFIYSPKAIKGLTFSQNYVSADAKTGKPGPTGGGVMSTGSNSTAVTQIGYAGDKTPLIGGSYAIAAAYTFSQNQIAASATPLAGGFAGNAGANSVALSGYWKPEKAGLIPSISWGAGTTSYKTMGVAYNTVTSTWYTGLQWDDAFIKGNAAGMAVGQAPFVTYGSAQIGCTKLCAPNDSNYLWEWWYKFQVTDNISVTPALYYISNFRGQSGKNLTGLESKNADFNAFGALIKTTFKF